MNTLQKFESKQLEKAVAESNIPYFSPGDTVKVNVKIREGSTERVQAYEGVCIARHDKGINASFTVRKISYSEGVERVFPLYSPRIESVEVIRRGSVRRAKLYYLRELRGKAARITERTSGHGIEAKVSKKAKKEAPAKTKETTAKKAPAKKTTAKKK